MGQEVSSSGPSMRGQHHGLTDQTLQAIGASADQRAKILSIQSRARQKVSSGKPGSGCRSSQTLGVTRRIHATRHDPRGDEILAFLAPRSATSTGAAA
jgi:hypothetical protein